MPKTPSQKANETNADNLRAIEEDLQETVRNEGVLGNEEILRAIEVSKQEDVIKAVIQANIKSYDSTHAKKLYSLFSKSYRRIKIVSCVLKNANTLKSFKQDIQKAEEAYQLPQKGVTVLCYRSLPSCYAPFVLKGRRELLLPLISE